MIMFSWDANGLEYLTAELKRKPRRTQSKISASIASSLSATAVK